MKKIYLIAIIIISSLLGLYSWYKSQVTFSVIIPVYNAEEFLPQCLNSIFNQKGNFEVIAVNDGSTDKSQEILEEYAKKHSNLVIINQKNSGVVAARNVGIQQAKNEYITFMDADDWVSPQAFQKILKIIKKDNSDIILSGYFDVYGSNWQKNTGSNGNSQVKRFPNRDLDKLALFSPFFGKDAISDLFYASGGVRLRFFRKNFIEQHNIIFPENIVCNEDAVFTFRAFLNNPLISVTTEPLHSYRNRPDSLSKSQHIINNVEKSLVVMQNTLEYKKAPHRTQMLIDDSWLFLINLGLANLHRHNIALENGLPEVYKAYKYMQNYNSEELKSCRNFIKLKSLLKNINQPL